MSREMAGIRNYLWGLCSLLVELKGEVLVVLQEGSKELTRKETVALEGELLSDRNRSSCLAINTLCWANKMRVGGEGERKRNQKMERKPCWS